MKNIILRSCLAGILIALAGCVYLSCANKIVGAALFSIGLYGCCELNAILFTGKVGSISSKQDLKIALISLLLNVITAFLVGLFYRGCLGPQRVFETIVNTQTWYRVLFESCICGAIIYISVILYRQTKNPIILILGVMAFILSGSLHSIACSMYLATGTITFKSILYLLIIIIGNSVGALLIRYFHIGFKK